jgi:pimeloyl-ACP methyl ester carboxylesterase
MVRKFVMAVAAVSAAALLGASAAAAEPRLFPDSQMVVQDRISVEVVGKGPDVVLVPGLASSRETWRKTAERLRSRYRLHLVQVAGFAGEPARANKDGPVVAQTAEAIDRYIVQQKLSPVVLVGHSLGGTMALYLAEHHPEHLKKVLLVDALPLYALAMTQGRDIPPEALHAMVERARAAVQDSTPDQYAATLKLQMAGMASTQEDRERVMGWTLASDRAVVASALAEDLQLDLRPGLGAIPVPITLLYPDYTPAGMPVGMVDPAYVGSYAPVPHKTLTRIDRSLHFIMYDQPEAFAAALDAFLAP